MIVLLFFLLVLDQNTLQEKFEVMMQLCPGREELPHVLALVVEKAFYPPNPRSLYRSYYH